MFDLSVFFMIRGFMSMKLFASDALIASKPCRFDNTTSTVSKGGQDAALGFPVTFQSGFSDYC